MPEHVIGDPRQAGESGPAGDQRPAGVEGPAGDTRPAGSTEPAPVDQADAVVEGADPDAGEKPTPRSGRKGRGKKPPAPTTD